MNRNDPAASPNAEDVLTLLEELHEFNGRFDDAFRLVPGARETLKKRINSKDTFVSIIYAAESVVRTEPRPEPEPVAVVVAAIRNGGLFAKFVEIEALYVRKEYRRSGLGENLINNVTLWAKNNGISDIRLFVSHLNKSAVSFYDHQGFNQLQLVLRKDVKYIK